MLSQIFRFIIASRKFWLFPVMLAMFLVGGLLILTKGSAIAPFIYTLF